MLILLEAEDEISKAQQKLERSIHSAFPKKAVKDIGYPGGTNYGATVFTNGNLWFWSGDANKKNESSPRRLNWFGLFSEDTALNISVEVNVPYKGRNGKVAGFFARDNDTGSIYLMHSGGVKGGTEGVGKSAFLAWSGERLFRAEDSSSGRRSAIVVMPIEGKAAIRSAIRYVDIIARFKQAVRDGETGTPEFKRKIKEVEDFYSEPSGRRKGKRSGQFDYFSRHGDVVDALYLWRKSKLRDRGERLVKNVLIDLGVVKKSELTEVYEVKTAADRGNIYTAIGQLMTHGTSDQCKRIMVLPDKEPIASDLERALERLGIELVNFELSDDKAIIV